MLFFFPCSLLELETIEWDRSYFRGKCLIKLTVSILHHVLLPRRSLAYCKEGLPYRCRCGKPFVSIGGNYRLFHPSWKFYKYNCVSFEILQCRTLQRTMTPHCLLLFNVVTDSKYFGHTVLACRAIKNTTCFEEMVFKSALTALPVKHIDKDYQDLWLIRKSRESV